ncbi:hypothetical protein MW887_007168 [Aspergillus wentii]|nr:hypothetical protein MW887_007168 [Aspergillus wentii]
MFAILLVILVFSIAGWRVLRPRPSKLPLPPGPNFVTALRAGNTDFKAFEEWTRQYGPVVSAQIGTRTYIILGTRQGAQDLLEKRGNIYSSRPASVLLDKYLSKGLAAAFMPYGREWRLNRRMHSSLLSARASETYHILQDVQSKQLLQGFLSNNNFSEAFHHYTSEVMFTLAFGKGQGKNDSDHQRLEQISEMVTFILQGASFGSTLLDLFPSFDLLPSFIWKWRTQASELHDKTKAAYTECCNTALESECWNWSHEIIQKKEVMELPWEHVCYSLGELYVAGVHTSKMVMEVFVQAVLLYPEVIQKAQKELDSVVGSDRLPTFEDIENLPYVNALISECLRWKPISPIAVPHAVIQDDEYMGYHIPKGATVVTNQYGMNMDENVFENPTAFNPDRYVENPDLPVSAFGFGRRLCPGHRVARSTLFIVIVRVLWGYDITYDGEKPTAETNAASVKAVFKIRSAERQKVIEQEAASADTDEKWALNIIREKLKGIKE